MLQAAVHGKPPKSGSKGSHGKQSRQHQSPAAATPVRIAVADDMDCIPDTPDEGSASKAVHAAAFGNNPGSKTGKAAADGLLSPINAAAYSTAQVLPAGTATHQPVAAASATVAGNSANAGGVEATLLPNAAVLPDAASAMVSADAVVGAHAVRPMAAKRMVPESPDEVPKDTLSLPEAAAGSQSQFSSTPAVLHEQRKSAIPKPGKQNPELCQASLLGTQRPPVAEHDAAQASSQAKAATNPAAPAAFGPDPAALVNQSCTHDLGHMHADADQHAGESMVLQLSTGQVPTITTGQAAVVPEVRSSAAAVAGAKQGVDEYLQQQQAAPLTSSAASAGRSAAAGNVMQRQLQSLMAATVTAPKDSCRSNTLQHASAATPAVDKASAVEIRTADLQHAVPQMLKPAFAWAPAGSLASDSGLAEQQACAGPACMSPVNDSALMAALDSVERKACHVC